MARNPEYTTIFEEHRVFPFNLTLILERTSKRRIEKENKKAK